MEEQRDAFVVTIEHEGPSLDNKTAITLQRALSDTAHRVIQRWLLVHEAGPDVEVVVQPITQENETA